MLQGAMSDAAAVRLAAQLDVNYPARVVTAEQLRAGSLPKNIFRPDRIFRQEANLILVHALATGEIPDWVRRAKKDLQKYRHVRIVL